MKVFLCVCVFIVRHMARVGGFPFIVFCFVSVVCELVRGLR